MINYNTHSSGRFNSYRGGINLFESGSSRTHNYTSFRWVGEILLDNSGATIDSHNKFLINKELAHRMKWILLTLFTWQYIQRCEDTIH